MIHVEGLNEGRGSSVEPSSTAADSLPLVSILIVTWNRRPLLGRSVESALAQTYPNKELVVVDNGSTDGTSDFIEHNFPGVRLVRLPSNLGCPSGRNAGFQHCRGEFIYSLDDDGWLDERAVERSVHRAGSDASIGVVVSAIRISDNGQVVRKEPPDPLRPVYQYNFAGGRSMIRASSLHEVGLYPEDFFRQAEENDLAIRFLDAGYFCFFEPTSIMYHEPTELWVETKASVFLELRNSNRTAIRLWPFPWVAFKVLVDMFYALREMFVLRYPLLPILIFQDVLLELANVPKCRRPVSYKTYRLFRRLVRNPSLKRPV